MHCKISNCVHLCVDVCVCVSNFVCVLVHVYSFVCWCVCLRVMVFVCSAVLIYTRFIVPLLGQLAPFLHSILNQTHEDTHDRHS